MKGILSTLLLPLLSLVAYAYLIFGCGFTIVRLLDAWAVKTDVQRLYFPQLSDLIGEQDRSNQFRLANAREFLAAADLKQFAPSNHERSETKVAIGIVASYRNKKFYLTQTLAYLVHELHEWPLPVLVCFVEPTADEEVEFLRPSFEFTFPNANRSFSRAPAGRNDEAIRKETADYWECLERTAASVPSADFVLLLEDDALPAEHLRRQLESTVRQLEEPHGRHVDYVKLFHPWYLRKLPSFVQIPVACFSFAFAPAFFDRRLRSSVFLLAALLGGFTLAAHLFVHNPQLPADLRFGLTGGAYLSSGESCCTQAVLFRAATLPTIISELRPAETRRGHAKDHVLDGSRFVGRQTDRNLFVHIGHYSALTQNYVEIPQV